MVPSAGGRRSLFFFRRGFAHGLSVVDGEANLVEEAPARRVQLEALHLGGNGRELQRVDQTASTATAE